MALVAGDATANPVAILNKARVHMLRFGFFGGDAVGDYNYHVSKHKFNYNTLHIISNLPPSQSQLDRVDYFDASVYRPSALPLSHRFGSRAGYYNVDR